MPGENNSGGGVSRCDIASSIRTSYLDEKLVACVASSLFQATIADVPKIRLCPPRLTRHLETLRELRNKLLITRRGSAEPVVKVGNHKIRGGVIGETR